MTSLSDAPRLRVEMFPRLAAGATSGAGETSIAADVAHKVVLNASVSPALREQYYKLAATLHNAQAVSGMKAIMVASAVAAEGKTLTAANLALTFSESYQRRVLLVDADVRRRSLHLLFGMQEPSHLSGDAPPTPPLLHVRQVTPRLGLLTTGRPSAAPMAELTSERMRHVIQDARQAFDWIIVDTPPLTVLADASLLVSMVDGVVLVVRAASTSLPLAKRALDVLDRKKVLGVVLNASRRPPGIGDGYADYYHTVAVPDVFAEGRLR